MRTIAIAAALLVLAGCSTTAADEPEPVVTVTETAEAPEPEPTETKEEAILGEGGLETDIEDELVTDVEMYYEDWRRFGSRSDLVELAENTCAFFEAGGTVDMYMENAETSNLPSDFATTMVAASLVNYCPELQDEVTNG